MADASRMPVWEYNQRTGQLRDPNGRLDKARGYSGSYKEKGIYKNNPAFEDKAFLGPIPKGLWYRGATTSSKGSLTLVIDPVGHNAHTRTDFRIHGDSTKHPGEASEGCIILNRRQREAIKKSEHRYLRVIDEAEW